MDFYYSPCSAPCRAILMAAKALGVELNKIVVDVEADEFPKKKPTHTIPTLIDDIRMRNSHEILDYLVYKYGKTSEIYPKFPKDRAIIMQQLSFDKMLYKAFADYYYPIFFLGKKEGAPAGLRIIEQHFGYLDGFLARNKWSASDFMTIADFALLATVSNFEAVNFDFSKYENVAKWYARAPTVPGWEENLAGVEDFKAYVKIL